jgi:hypothetical protein
MLDVGCWEIIANLVLRQLSFLDDLRVSTASGSADHSQPAIAG